MDISIIQASPEDAAEILALQKVAYQSEARRNDDWTIPPLITGTKSMDNIPFVIGELACGNLSSRGELLSLLSELPLVTSATNEEVMHLIERHKLSGKGLGWIDMNLLASALISRIPLWTRDRRLAAVAKTLGIIEHK